MDNAGEEHAVDTSWQSLCAACGAMIQEDVDTCPECGGEVVPVDKLLRTATRKYPRGARAEQLKRELKESWYWILIPVVAQFLIGGPAVFAVLMLQANPGYLDAVATWTFAIYWMVSVLAAFLLMRVYSKITKIYAEEHKDD